MPNFKEGETNLIHAHSMENSKISFILAEIYWSCQVDTCFELFKWLFKLDFLIVMISISPGMTISSVQLQPKILVTLKPNGRNLLFTRHF